MSNALKKAKPLSQPAVQSRDRKIQDLIRFVRTHSPFYRKLYQELPDLVFLKDLPIVSHEDYWKANTLPANQLLTGPLNDGIIFNTGGTTGNPKFSVFTKEEWEIIIQANANILAKGQMQKNDRVGNLFYAGAMYGSFVFTTQFMGRSHLDLLQLPIAGQTPNPEVKRIVLEFNINVLIGGPARIMDFADFMIKNPEAFNPLQIERVLFAGEPFNETQRKVLKEIFPKVQISSIGYASNDGGILGYADTTCEINEHRMFGNQTIVEIVDEKTLEVIEEKNKVGRILVTNLERKLMPTIRYPVGDMGMWTEPAGNPDRKFKLMGRSEQGAKIGRNMYYLQDIQNLLSPYIKKLKISDFQMIIQNQGTLNGLILRLASPLNASQLKPYNEQIKKDFNKAYPIYTAELQQGEVLGTEIEWVSQAGLEINPRTGKMSRVVDKRK